MHAMTGSAPVLPPVSGAQTLERAIVVLRALSQGAAPNGMGLAGVSAKAGLTKATTRRLLLALERAGLVLQDPSTRNYRLGVGLYALGLAAERQYDLVSICAPSLRRIAAETGDLALFQARAGDDAVCLAREIGSYPLQAALQSVGERYPVGVGAGGTAILAGMPDSETERFIARMLDLRTEAPAPINGDDARARVNRARKLGYHYHDGRYWPGIRELAMAVNDKSGLPCGAITLGAVEKRMPEDRIEPLLGILRREKAVMEAELARI